MELPWLLQLLHARARTPLIHSSAHAEVRSRRRGEKKRGEGGSLFAGVALPGRTRHTRSHLCCCCRIQLRSYKLICFGKFAAAFTQKVVYERKSQSRARTITEMIKFNANALENMSKCCLFHCKCEIFGAIYLKILSNITCFYPNELASLLLCDPTRGGKRAALKITQNKEKGSHKSTFGVTVVIIKSPFQRKKKPGHLQ